MLRFLEELESLKSRCCCCDCVGSFVFRALISAGSKSVHLLMAAKNPPKAPVKLNIMRMIRSLIAGCCSTGSTPWARYGTPSVHQLPDRRRPENPNCLESVQPRRTAFVGIFGSPNSTRPLVVYCVLDRASTLSWTR